jgi:hypothetical protein
MALISVLGLRLAADSASPVDKVVDGFGDRAKTGTLAPLVRAAGRSFLGGNHHSEVAASDRNGELLGGFQLMRGSSEHLNMRVE